MPMQSFKTDSERVYYVDQNGSGLVMYSDKVQGLGLSPLIVSVPGILTSAQRIARTDLLLFPGAQIKESDTGSTFEVKGGAWARSTSDLVQEAVAGTGFSVVAGSSTTEPASYVPWSPALVPGARLWYSAEDALTASGALAGVGDAVQSIPNRLQTVSRTDGLPMPLVARTTTLGAGSAANRPIKRNGNLLNGRMPVSFGTVVSGGTTMRLGTQLGAMSPTGVHRIFMVVAVRGTSFPYIAAWSNTTGQSIVSGNGSRQLRVGTDSQIIGSFTDSTYFLLSFERPGTEPMFDNGVTPSSVIGRINGARYAGNATAATSQESNNVGLVIGNRGDTDVATDLDFQELTAFEVSKMTKADMYREEGRLAWKYGIQATLPGDHPYRSAAPTVPVGITTSPDIDIVMGPWGVSHTMDGFMFEIGDGNIGANDGAQGADPSRRVLYDLVPPQRAVLAKAMRGAYAVRNGAGIYYRGLRNIDGTSGLARNIGPEYADQRMYWAQFQADAQMTGEIFEYWSPAPHWKTTSSLAKGALWAGGAYPRLGPTITDITKANPGVLTYTGTDPTNDMAFMVDDVVGMTQMNARNVRVKNVNTGAKTFQLTNIDGTNLDTSAYGTYTSGGTLHTTVDSLRFVGQVVTAITKASPGVITYTGTDPANGDIGLLSSIVGMTELNDWYVKVANVNTGAKTFQLTTISGANINTSAFTTYVSGGVFSTAFYLQIDAIAAAMVDDAENIHGDSQYPRRIVGFNLGNEPISSGAGYGSCTYSPPAYRDLHKALVPRLRNSTILTKWQGQTNTVALRPNSWDGPAGSCGLAITADTMVLSTGNRLRSEMAGWSFHQISEQNIDPNAHITTNGTTGGGLPYASLRSTTINPLGLSALRNEYENFRGSAITRGEWFSNINMVFIRDINLLKAPSNCLIHLAKEASDPVAQWYAPFVFVAQGGAAPTLDYALGLQPGYVAEVTHNLNAIQPYLRWTKGAQVQIAQEAAYDANIAALALVKDGKRYVMLINAGTSPRTLKVGVGRDAIRFRGVIYSATQRDTYASDVNVKGNVVTVTVPGQTNLVLAEV